MNLPGPCEYSNNKPIKLDPKWSFCKVKCKQETRLLKIVRNSIPGPSYYREIDLNKYRLKCNEISFEKSSKEYDNKDIKAVHEFFRIK